MNRQKGRRAPDAKSERPRRSGPVRRAEAYLLRHLQTFFATLGQLSRRPFATLLTAAVLGIALALPAGLQVLLQNAAHVVRGWDGSARISVFLKQDLPQTQIDALRGRLRAMPGVGSVTYISATRALAEFKQYSGFGKALAALDGNPLPAVLVVHPGPLATTPAALKALAERLRAQPEVDLAQLDLHWVRRLYAITGIASRGVWLLAAMLGLAVLLVVGNTIRLAIQNRRDEIVISKLIGGTDAFIRRPFLYTGLWYGLFGAVLAVLLVQGSLLLLSGPVRHLADLYGSLFRLSGLDLNTTFALLAAGPGLGLLGAWLAVGRHLRSIEPT